MSWINIGLLGIVAVTAAAIWWRRRQAYTLTSHHVHCPVHDEEARINVYTNAQARRPYVDVAACSLHPSGPIFVPNKIEWVPEIAYYASGMASSVRGPIHQVGVSCRKGCLSMLNQDDMHVVPRHTHHVSGMNDCMDLEREATYHTVAETSTTQTPWSYGG